MKGRLWGQLAAPWLGRQGSLAVGKAMAHPNAVPGADSGSEEGWVTSELRWMRLVHGPAAEPGSATAPSAGLRLAGHSSTGKLPEPSLAG